VIKVLYILSTLKQAGPVMMLYNLLKYLDKTKFNPIILTLSPEPVDSMQKRFEDINIPVHSLNQSRIRGLFTNIRNINNIISSLKPDIIHTHGIRSDSIIHKLNIKNHISTIHIFTPEDYKIKYGKYIGGMMVRNHIKIIKEIPYSIACSQSLSTRFHDELGVKLAYVNNGIDDRYFKITSETEKMKQRKKFNFDEDNKIFLSVSELNSGKNLEILIKYFKMTTNKELKLIIVGSGPEKDSLKNLASSFKNIIFAGKVANTQEYYNYADYFISASFSEGLPLSALEAMASGLPVILSNIPGHKALFKESDKYPFFFECSDIKDLGNKIDKVLTEDYSKAAKKMRNIVSANFSAKTMTENYTKIYKKIIN
jgi:glycosyltransferase involved in cell wall biosynthesis